MYLVGLVCSVKEADEDWAAMLKSPPTSYGGDCRSDGERVLPSFAAACFQRTLRLKRGVKSSITVGMISAFFNLIEMSQSGVVILWCIRHTGR